MSPIVKVGEITVEILATTSKLRANLAQASSLIRDFALLGQGLTSGITSAFRQVSDVAIKGLQVGIAALVGSFALAAKTGAEFENEMVRAFTIMREGGNATADSLSKMTNMALELGRETLFSAIDAAQGMQVLARAGFDTREVLASIGPVLNLAIADNLELSESADIVVAALRSFNLESREARRVTDILALGASKANTNVSMLGEAFKYVAPVAAGMGISIEETVAAIGILSDAGLKGSLAGTTLRRAFSELISPTQKSQKILDELGVVATTSSGKLKPFATILRDLKNAGMTAAQAMEVFGLRGGPGMVALLSRGSGALSELTRALESSKGTAEDMSQAFRTTVKGRILDLKASVVDLGLAFSEKFKKPLADFIFAIRNYVVEIVNTGNRTNLFKAIVEGFISAFTPFKGKIEEVSNAFRGWIASLTPQIVSKYFDDIRQRVDNLIKALESKTVTNTLENIKDQLGGIKDSIGGIAAIAATVWEGIPDAWKPHIASLLVLNGLIIKLFGGVFNIVMGFITIDAIVKSFLLKITFGEALMLRWGKLVYFIRVLFLGLIGAALILSGIVASMTFFRFLSDLKLVQKSADVLKTTFAEIGGNVRVAMAGIAAMLQPRNVSAQIGFQKAKEDLRGLREETNKAAKDLKDFVTSGKVGKDFKEKIGFKAITKGMGESLADIGTALAGSREKSLLEKFRPKVTEVPKISYGMIEGLGGGFEYQEDILKKYLEEIQQGITGEIKPDVIKEKKKRPTEQEAFAESYVETIGKSREVMEKLGSKNYEELLNESKELLDKFVGLGESTLDSMEIQKEINDYIDKRITALTEKSNRLNFQGIDKQVKDSYGKPRLGAGINE